MFGVHVAAVVDAASRYDDHVAVFSYEEIVIDDVVQAALLHDHGDMDALIFRAGLNVDIDSGSVFLGDNLDVGGVLAPCQLAVASDVVGALRDGVEVRYFHEDPLLDLV